MPTVIIKVAENFHAILVVHDPDKMEILDLVFVKKIGTTKEEH